jgi:hypothetical protein
MIRYLLLFVLFLAHVDSAWSQPDPTLPPYGNGQAMLTPGGTDGCLVGKADGYLHGHRFGQFLIGAVQPVWGIVGCAVVNRTPYGCSNPEKILVHQSMWSDPAYLACYNQSARKQAIAHSAAGTLSVFSLVGLAVLFAGAPY